MARRETPFECIESVGGVLPVDLLERVASGDKRLPGLSPEAYHLDSSFPMGEAINRSWTRLLVAWSSFRRATKDLDSTDPAIGVTRDKWLLPLFEELRYGRLTPKTSADFGGRAISHAYHKTPIHLVGRGVDLNKVRKSTPGAAAASPHGLVQDFLNHSTEHLWGFVSNGLVLRILRDSKSLTRLSYLELDLEEMFDGERYSDFRLLWLTCHQSRVEAEKPEECWLEQWFAAARSEGVQALDRLRGGVEKALTILGTGFVRHRSNESFRHALASGDLRDEDLYHELLRLAYRLIFLFVAEDRGLLLDPSAPAEARARYHLYATSRLRRLAGQRRGGPHGDLWVQLRLVMAKLQEGCPELALPGLGSLLWSPEALPHLTGCELANEDLLAALRTMCSLEEGGVRRAVSWAALASDELGSIYESLMELHPVLNLEAGRLELAVAAGNERKTTGSYYTPTSLVECLLDTALDPVLDEACGQKDPVKALLDLKIVDPACGSGHFLVAAARRLARRLAMARSGDREPSPLELQAALRDVVGRCIFGVDSNPMAVELCKVALWMEAVEPGKPLSFLESHIQLGNSLLGATPALMDNGIPDEAFEPLEGDDKKIASRLKKRNKDERKGQASLFATYADLPTQRERELRQQASALEAAPDGTLGEVRGKETAYQALRASAAWREAWFLGDLWCSAFVWPKTSIDEERAAPTQELWRRAVADVAACPPETREIARELARASRLFHWHLAFPTVFDVARGEPGKTTGWPGGFDVVLGNPPWERIKLQEQEFFATRDETIAKAPNAAARKKLIAALPTERPTLWQLFREELRVADGESQLVRRSGRYPLCGRGDINTYAIFAELNRALISLTGRVGCIVPSGIATDDTTKDFFHDLMASGTLRSIYDFQSGPGYFGAIGHGTFKFSLVTLGAGRAPADFAFFLRDVAQLSAPERRFSLSADDLALLNPNTSTCPIFRGRRDAEITKAIYRRVPVLIREGEPEQNAWGFRVATRWLHMAEDSEIFRTSPQLEPEGFRLDGNHMVRGEERWLPLYEAKMVHHFDHRFGDYRDKLADSENTALPEVPVERLQDPAFAPLPRYWVPHQEVDERLAARGWQRGWLLGWRDITKTQNERTVLFAVIPRVGVGHTTPLCFTDRPELMGHLAASLSSFALDYAARQKIGGTHLTFHVMKQLPVLPPETYEQPCPWAPGQAYAAWIRSRVLELTVTADDMLPFGRDLGYDGPPFRWDEERRFWLRSELDAAFFHLYGIPRDDVAYIMDTFPIVRGYDEKEHGSYRTKDAILDVLDRLAVAAAEGGSYRTVLDPPPADPAAAHAGAATQTDKRSRRVATLAAQIRSIEDRGKTGTRIVQLPTYNLLAAAGSFDQIQAVGTAQMRFFRASRPHEQRKGEFHFAAQVQGRSMEPTIPDGAWCAFRRPATIRNGVWVLVERNLAEDPERGGRYVVKEYRGGSRPQLLSTNPEFEPIEIAEADRIIAEWEELLEPSQSGSEDE